MSEKFGSIWKAHSYHEVGDDDQSLSSLYEGSFELRTFFKLLFKHFFLVKNGCKVYSALKMCTTSWLSKLTTTRVHVYCYLLLLRVRYIAICLNLCAFCYTKITFSIDLVWSSKAMYSSIDDLFINRHLCAILPIELDNHKIGITCFLICEKP